MMCLTASGILISIVMLLVLLESYLPTDLGRLPLVGQSATRVFCSIRFALIPVCIKTTKLSFLSHAAHIRIFIHHDCSCKYINKGRSECEHTARIQPMRTCKIYHSSADKCCMSDK